MTMNKASRATWQDFISIKYHRSDVFGDELTMVYYFVWAGTNTLVYEEYYLWRSKINAIRWIEQSDWQAKVDEQFEKEFLK